VGGFKDKFSLDGNAYATLAFEEAGAPAFLALYQHRMNSDCRLCHFSSGEAGESFQ
jgi:hypothetical protein